MSQEILKVPEGSAKVTESPSERDINLVNTMKTWMSQQRWLCGIHSTMRPLQLKCKLAVEEELHPCDPCRCYLSFSGDKTVPWPPDMRCPVQDARCKPSTPETITQQGRPMKLRWEYMSVCDLCIHGVQQRKSSYFVISNRLSCIQVPWHW